MIQSSQGWTLEEINRGIAKLKRRIGELQVLLDTQVKYEDPLVRNAELEIPTTIEDVFGEESREYEEYSYVRLRSEILSKSAHETAPAAEQRNQSEFIHRVHEIMVRLQGLVKRLEEKKEDFKKCPKCHRTYPNFDYCLEDGTFLVSLSYDPDSPTLSQHDN